MESNFKEVPRDDAAQALDSLAVDQENFAESVRVPWTLMAAFGALSAWFVDTASMTEPGGNYEPPLGIWLALLGVLVVSYLVQRDTGIQFRSMGIQAKVFIIGIFGLNLSLFSVSLGLVSSGMSWIVLITSIVGFIMTTVMSGITYRQAAENVYRA